MKLSKLLFLSVCHFSLAAMEELAMPDYKIKKLLFPANLNHYNLSPEIIDMNQNEPSSEKPWWQILLQTESLKFPLIFCRVNTGNEISYHEAATYNKSIFGSIIPSSSTSCVLPDDPITQQPMVEPIYYFIIKNAWEDTAYYFGSSSELIMRTINNPIEHLLNACFHSDDQIRRETQLEVGEYFFSLNEYGLAHPFFKHALKEYRRAQKSLIQLLDDERKAKRINTLEELRKKTAKKFELKNLAIKKAKAKLLIAAIEVEGGGTIIPDRKKARRSLQNIIETHQSLISKFISALKPDESMLNLWISNSQISHKNADEIRHGGNLSNKTIKELRLLKVISNTAKNTVKAHFELTSLKIKEFIDQGILNTEQIDIIINAWIMLGDINSEDSDDIPKQPKAALACYEKALKLSTDHSQRDAIMQQKKKIIENNPKEFRKEKA